MKQTVTIKIQSQHLPYKTAPAQLTGRWRIIKYPGHSNLYLECKYNSLDEIWYKKPKRFLWYKYFEDDFRHEMKTHCDFIHEDLIDVLIKTEFPIQNCINEEPSK